MLVMPSTDPARVFRPRAESFATRDRPTSAAEARPRSRASRGSWESGRAASAEGAPSSTMRPPAITITRSNPAVSAMSCVTQISVASRQRSRARRSSVARLSRSSPRNGSSRIARRAGARPSARPNRTRCPSPPERSAPPSPSDVCSPSGSCAMSGRRSASATRAPTGRPAVPVRPKSRLSASDRFHNWTAGSIHAVSRRRPSRRAPSRRSPSTMTCPDAGRCHPSSNPTSVDLPAPDAPTIATWAPGAIASVASSRIALAAGANRDLVEPHGDACGALRGRGSAPVQPCQRLSPRAPQAVRSGEASGFAGWDTARRSARCVDR